MLEQLTIKNVAVIDRLEFEPGTGLCVLTGETGAGKSIIIDSINMILGDRARRELVRSGAEHADVQAVFSMPEDVRAMLEENEIDTEDGSVIITRRVTREGKSSARINGTVVTLNVLRDIADLLINIHGQHDNQALLDPARHVRFLDAYARTENELSEYKRHYSRAKEISARLRALTSDEQEKLRRADLLSYQINEINAAALTEGEEEELAAERRLLENAEAIGENTEKAYAALYDYPDGRSAYDLISDAVDATEELAGISPALAAAHEAIRSAMYAIEDAAREIHEFGGNADFDPQALEDTMERLDLINRLKRKYGGSISEINEFRDRAKEELSDIETSDEQAERLKAELEMVKAELKKAAAALTKKRAAAAGALEKEIENALHELNMKKASFSVKVEPEKYTPNGADAVEFMISTNPGEPQKPLVKIASGGELSRVMLAIKSILAEADGVETLIFDEIDTGVSGAAAQKIADKLKGIGRHKQVICITHLPQLAQAADDQYLIEKDTDGELARTTLSELDREGRIKELARIVGGGKAGEEYARSVLG